ncbi:MULTISPECIES: TetR/AcrR family transcriptional regulator [Streptacidiphilus]|uniref:TetR/AcrR family transcriptional regulator n=1 Tax=Streptacidiphilus cavernicola TaxID=3342716 RepID=A0ABV6UL43_9ACTN|nr:TetR/AcrR family transcriptional regulator [Streptacidiphilus jeojiense]
MATARDAYHHGDLRAALLNAALELLEEGDEAALSLRAVARRAGVSPNAPYRHYPDKDDLLAALATHGFQDLRRTLLAAEATAAPGEELVTLAQAYVRYALDHQALFGLMFARPCDVRHPETRAAADETYAVLSARVAAVNTRPADEQAAFMAGSWALVHGLASLVLYGKLARDSKPEELSALVRSVVDTMCGPA